MTLEQAVSAYGASVKAKLNNPSVAGAPEDQLRAPLETLFAGLARLSGIPDGLLTIVGETTLSEVMTRPDFAASVNNELRGFVEVKAPGKGADPRRFRDAHDKAQWRKLQSLPNLLYTDGNEFSLWRDGKLEGQIVRLHGDVETSGEALAAPEALLTLFRTFLDWTPIPPRTPQQLAETSARLCRLLREEVREQLSGGSVPLRSLAEDWRDLLFPAASDAKFADGYAQAITFGLLVARAQGIGLSDGIEQAGLKIGRNTLIGAALRLFTDSEDAYAALKTSLETLKRVFDVVDWPMLSKGDPEAWLYFYEQFLAVYDNELRKDTGSYYTPPEVVAAMVRLVDEALADPAYFDEAAGLASPEVTIADPAVGTGTFLLGVLRKIAARVSADYGEGSVPGEIGRALERLYGFEIQFGPFAVAQLRLLAEVQDLLGPGHGSDSPLPSLHLYLTDTLGNPLEEEERFASMLQPIARSRIDANRVKREQPITVVIGNPPYKEKARGLGGWIEAGSAGRNAPLDYWQPPNAWDVGAHAKHLRNLYIYFWRWATWKVFGDDQYETSGLPETPRHGIVCYITVSGFLNGPGFEKMRADLRRSCDAIWVIDCSPEGHQPPIASRIFQGVQQPVCIVLALRKPISNEAAPAVVRFRRLGAGPREDKFRELTGLHLDDADWTLCPSDARAPFLPPGRDSWTAYPTLSDFFLYNGSGVMPGRTWVIAPDARTLHERWERLQRESDPDEKERLFHPHEGGDRTVARTLRDGLQGYPHRDISVAADNGPCIPPMRYGFRTLDRQWIIPDKRLINRPNPTLWGLHSNQQVYMTALEAHSPSNGPAASTTDLVPDLHHYKGSFGGRVFPLWANAGGTDSNVTPALLRHLSARFERAVQAPEVFAYLAALLCHPGFTERFADDLVQPGLRMPLTADRDVFEEAAALGREVVWLQTYGERFVDPAAGRPHAKPRMPAGTGPTVPAGGAVPDDPAHFPDALDYDAAERRLHVGLGHIDRVSPEMVAYRISGKNLLTQWFSYRKADRSRPLIGDKRPPSPLENIRADRWLPEYTADLLDLLHVLGRLIALEPAQKELLDRICRGPLLTREDLAVAGALDKPTTTRGRGGGSRQGLLL